MPSREQMERAIRKIEALSEEYSFRRYADRRVAVAPHGRGTDDGFSFWGELTDAQKQFVLAGGVDWEGFTEGEKADVIGRVIAPRSEFLTVTSAPIVNREGLMFRIDRSPDPAVHRACSRIANRVVFAMRPWMHHADDRDAALRAAYAIAREEFERHGSAGRPGD